MKAKHLALILLPAFLWAAPVFAQPSAAASGAIVTLSGKIYKNASVQKVAPDGLLISYAPPNGGLGIAKIKFTDLPADLQQRYGYNVTNAAAFERAEQESARRLREQLLAQDALARSNRLALDLSDAWSDAKRGGTGFFITDDGYLLTCYHVVTNATRIQVGTSQGVLSAALVQFDEDKDIALLKVAGTFAALPLAPSNSVRFGEAVFTVGFPNPDMQGLQPKLTRGEISSLTGLQDNPDEYQISVPVQPGNSGGALMDEYGNVTGIVFARLSDKAALATSGMIAQAVNYAMSTSRLHTFVNAVPGLPGRLKPPHPSANRKFQDVVQEAQSAVALVIVN